MCRKLIYAKLLRTTRCGDAQTAEIDMWQLWKGECRQNISSNVIIFAIIGTAPHSISANSFCIFVTRSIYTEAQMLSDEHEPLRKCSFFVTLFVTNSGIQLTF